MKGTTEEKKIRVLIADDHPAVREGLCRALEAAGDIEVVAQATNGEETVSLAKELDLDVAIIDAAMPELSGIDAARQVKESCPTIAIIILSAYDYRPYVLAALRARVEGYLLKSTPLNDIISAVRMAHNGEAVFDRKVVADILPQLGDGTNKSSIYLVELRGREMEVLKLAAKGKNNRDIAEQLQISERTVQTHFVNIFQKMKVGSRTEAVVHALKNGWLTLDDLP